MNVDQAHHRGMSRHRFGLVSAVESKPARDGRIKTSHFFCAATALASFFLNASSSLDTEHSELTKCIGLQ
jgi:hypothetical protein